MDRWLCAARLFKSRTVAQQACVGGLVRVNDLHVKSHHGVHPGDRLAVQTPAGLRLLEVLALAERRQSPPRARELYEDHSPPPPPRKEPDVGLPLRERGAGRPTKRERRELRGLRGR